MELDWKRISNSQYRVYLYGDLDQSLLEHLGYSETPEEIVVEVYLTRESHSVSEEMYAFDVEAQTQAMITDELKDFAPMNDFLEYAKENYLDVSDYDGFYYE